MSRFLSPTLSAVTPYTPGEQPQDQQYIKLNTNESPYLPSPAVVAAVSEAEVEKLRLYSDPACADLLRAAAAHFGLQDALDGAARQGKAGGGVGVGDNNGLVQAIVVLRVQREIILQRDDVAGDVQ